LLQICQLETKTKGFGFVEQVTLLLFRFGTPNLNLVCVFRCCFGFCDYNFKK